MKLSVKLALIFPAFAAATVLSVGLLHIREGTAALKKSAVARLQIVAQERYHELFHWIDASKSVVQVTALNVHIKEHLKELDQASLPLEERQIAESHIREHLLAANKLSDTTEDHFLVHPETGRVMFSTKLEDEGTFKNDKLYFTEGRKKTVLQPMYFSPSLGRLVMAVATPVTDSDGRLLAVAASRINMARIEDLMEEPLADGYNPDVYLIHETGLFATKPNGLTRQEMASRMAQTKAVKNCLAGQSGLEEGTNYKKVPVFTVYQWLGPLHLCLLVEAERASVLAPVAAFKRNVTLLMAAALAVSLILAALVARMITRPLSEFQEAVRKLAAGETAPRLHESRKDELGLLASEFNKMAAKLTRHSSALAEANDLMELKVEQRTTQLAKTISALRDEVVERKKAEERMRETSELIQSVTDAAQDAIVLIDENAEIVFWNPAAARMFGYGADEALGHNVHGLLAPDEYREAANRGFAAFRKTGKGPVVGATVELDGRRKDGIIFPVSLSIASVSLRDKRHAVGIIRDITDRREAEEALNQTRKMESLGNLAGGIAHDINNMLLPILSLPAMVAENLPEDSRDRKRLEMTNKAALRIKALVTKILAFSRREEAAREKVNIAELVEEALTLLRSTLPKTITLHEEIDQKTGSVLADRTQIISVLVNLATNAGDAMEGRTGDIYLSLAPVTATGRLTALIPNLTAGRHAKFAITDTGCGMDKRTLERVFDPFFTTKEAGKGTGLGLSMVHGIITDHHGAIKIDSSPGEGTTVEIYLPLVVVEKA